MSFKPGQVYIYLEHEDDEICKLDISVIVHPTEAKQHVHERLWSETKTYCTVVKTIIDRWDGLLDNLYFSIPENEEKYYTEAPDLISILYGGSKWK